MLLILVGCYHILLYILEKLNATILDLFSGGVLLVIGVFLFTNPQIVVKLLPVLLGTFILADSIWSLKGSLKLKKNGSGFWKILLIGSLIFIGLGVSLVLNPFTMVKYTEIIAGWIFLCNGVDALSSRILLRRGLKERNRKQKQSMQTARSYLMMQKVLHSQKNRSYRNTHRGAHAGRQNQQTIYLTVRKKLLIKNLSTAMLMTGKFPGWKNPSMLCR